MFSGFVNHERQWFRKNKNNDALMARFAELVDEIIIDDSVTLKVSSDKGIFTKESTWGNPILKE